MSYWGIEDVILTILAILIIVILLGTIYSIIRAIIQFIFSNGDAAKIKKAWDGIRYTIIGIIITVFLLFFFPIIFQKVSPSSGQSYTAKAILSKAMGIGKYLLSVWGLENYWWTSWENPRSIEDTSPITSPDTYNPL